MNEYSLAKVQYIITHPYIILRFKDRNIEVCAAKVIIFCDKRKKNWEKFWFLIKNT